MPRQASRGRISPESYLTFRNILPLVHTFFLPPFHLRTPAPPLLVFLFLLCHRSQEKSPRHGTIDRSFLAFVCVLSPRAFSLLRERGLSPQPYSFARSGIFRNVAPILLYLYNSHFEFAWGLPFFATVGQSPEPPASRAIINRF